MTKCGNGVHEMTPENTGVQRSTGRQFCRACKNARKRRARGQKRPPTDLCGKGLHSMGDPTNVYLSPAGKRACRACRDERDRLRREPVEPVEIKRTSVVPPAGIRSVGRGGGDAAARYRLALLVRGRM